MAATLLRVANMIARSTTIGLSWLVLVLLAPSCARVPAEDAPRRVSQADAYLQRKQFQEAILEYRNALKLDPSIGTARLNLARAYVGAKDYKNAYLEYMRSVVEYYEGQSKAIVGREIAQILLLHAHALNAVALDRLADGLKGRGYQFITLRDALEDPAYSSRDEYYGPPVSPGCTGGH